MEYIKILENVEIDNKDAFIIVDMQYDFMPKGALPVKEGDQIIKNINIASAIFKKKKAIIILTQDWHPRDHLSFASNHPGKKPGDAYQTEAIGPVLWPDHCVQGSKGAYFHKKLNTDFASAIIRKGTNPKVDSYSGFLENDKKTETGLAGYLNSLGIKKIFICGLALDYCCYSTAIDGINFGFEVYFFLDLTKGIDIPPGNISKSIEHMTEKGVKFVDMTSLK